MAIELDQLWDYNDPAATEERFRQRLPELPTNTPERVELLSQIARTHSLRGNFEQAHAILDTAFSELAEGWDRARVRCLLERGRTFNSARQRADALACFSDAWDLARRFGEDALAVDAAHMLAIASPPEEQVSWNLRALELAESSPDARAKQWRASLYNNLGWTYHDQGDYETALGYFQKAYHQRQANQQPAETRIAAWCVARCLRSLGQVEEALAMQHALREEVEQTGDSDGYIYEELGELLTLRGDSAGAAPYFARAYQALSQDAWLVKNEPDRLARLRQLAGEHLER